MIEMRMEHNLSCHISVDVELVSTCFKIQILLETISFKKYTNSLN